MRRKRLCESCHRSFITFEVLERYFRESAMANAILANFRRLIEGHNGK